MRAQGCQITIILVISCFGINCQWHQWSIKINNGENKETKSDSESQGAGTYNPKSAWMFVDKRRRVLPDIDGECLIRNFWHANTINHVL